MVYNGPVLLCRTQSDSMEPKISFRLPEDLYEKAKEKARREDITLSQVLRRCLREWASEDPPEKREKEDP
jgi:hypothetical protein